MKSSLKIDMDLFQEQFELAIEEWPPEPHIPLSVIYLSPLLYEEVQTEQLRFQVSEDEDGKEQFLEVKRSSYLLGFKFRLGPQPFPKEYRVDLTTHYPTLSQEIAKLLL